MIDIDINLVSSAIVNLFATHSDTLGSVAASVDITDKGLIGMGAGMATTGCLGAGIGQGFNAGKACEAIGRNPESAKKVQTIFIVGAAIAESGAIYSLLVALILLFVYGNL